MSETDQPTCEHCGRTGDSERAAPAEPFCPVCGAAVAIMPLLINGHAFEGGIRLRVRDRQNRMDLTRNKADLHRDSGRDRLVNRTIIYRADHYDEAIVEPETCAVVRVVNEPLSEHQGRGSAKPKKSDK